MMSITTKSGTSISGALKEETKTAITLILPDKTETIVKIPDIATRTQPISTMPPMGTILSSSELRDLVAFLTELK
jgi:quinoprotein glucose dehydrogenase